MTRSGRPTSPNDARPDIRPGAGAGGAASPLLVFAALASVVLLAAAAGFLVDSDRFGGDRITRGPESSRTSSASGMSLTNEEAIARFEELEGLRRQAYEQRSISLLRKAFIKDGPVFPIIRNEIRELLRDDVRSLSRFRNLDLSVSTNTPRRIQLRQVRVVHPRFVDENGINITVDETAQRQVVEWDLRPVKTQWLIYDSVVVSAKDVR